jgi:hypothetical protein
MNFIEIFQFCVEINLSHPSRPRLAPPPPVVHDEVTEESRVEPENTEDAISDTPMELTTNASASAALGVTDFTVSSALPR